MTFVDVEYIACPACGAAPHEPCAYDCEATYPAPPWEGGRNEQFHTMTPEGSQS